MKHCSNCDKDKKDSEFYQTGYKHCRTCRALYIKERRAKKPEMFKTYQRNYYYKDVQLSRKRSKEKSIKNREKNQIRSRLYRIQNAAKLKAKHHEYYLKNKTNPKFIKSKKKAYDAHIKTDKYRHTKNTYVRTKRSTDPNFKLRVAISNRIRNALVRGSKASTSEVLLGCKFKDFKLYIERLFKDGMNWNNYGQWHLDHIRPCISFDLTTLEGQQKCFHYSNLQPLWWQDNLSKGSKY